MLFKFELEQRIVTVYIDWEYVVKPVVGDYIYLYDYLDENVGNISLELKKEDSEYKYNMDNIDIYLKDVRFKIVEKMWIQGKKLEYKLVECPM